MIEVSADSGQYNGGRQVILKIHIRRTFIMKIKSSVYWAFAHPLVEDRLPLLDQSKVLNNDPNS